MGELLKFRNLKVRSLLKDTLPGLSVGKRKKEVLQKVGLAVLI